MSKNRVTNRVTNATLDVTLYPELGNEERTIMIVIKNNNKITKSLESGGLIEQIPYPSAKAMPLIDSEDPDEIKEWVSLIINDLK